jgi:hypothetical protein
MANRNEPLCLRGEGERLSVSLAVLEQVLLVPLQKLERDFARVLDAMPVAETDESAEVLSPAVDRRLRVGCERASRASTRLCGLRSASCAAPSSGDGDAGDRKRSGRRRRPG